MSRFARTGHEETARALEGSSRFLSYILRHRPDKVGIALDRGGWVEIDALLAAIAAHGEPLGRGELLEIVRTNAKRRFAISEDGRRIRASQGHSLRVDLGLARRKPPTTLFHGTAERFLESIRRKGLLRMRRHHVHLSADAATAREVGGRHGNPAVLAVDAAAMDRDGHAFFLTDNGVWLTDRVPPRYLAFPAPAGCRAGNRG